MSQIDENFFIEKQYAKNVKKQFNLANQITKMEKEVSFMKIIRKRVLQNPKTQIMKTFRNWSRKMRIKKFADKILDAQLLSRF